MLQDEGVRRQEKFIGGFERGVLGTVLVRLSQGRRRREKKRLREQKHGPEKLPRDGRW